MWFGRLKRTLESRWRGSRGSVSTAIVFACVALNAAIMLLDRAGVVERDQSIFVLGLSFAGIVRHLWLFQFLTAPLLHMGFLHLAFNMLTLWMLGPDVEMLLGRAKYLFFSAVCAFAGSVGFLLFDQGSGQIAGGYSAVIFGILVAQAVHFPDRLICIYAFFPVKMKYAVLILAAVEAAMSFEPDGSWVAHSAHFFGAAAGWVFLQLASGRRKRSVVASLAGPPVNHGDVAPTRKPSRSGGGPARTASPERRAAATLQPLVLRVVNGTSAGRRAAIRNRSVSIGRDVGCDLVLSGDAKISRRHAEVVPDGHGGCVIQDAGSRNGVYINGERTTRMPLRPGDRVRLGNTELVVHAGDNG